MFCNFKTAERILNHRIPMKLTLISVLYEKSTQYKRTALLNNSPLLASWYMVSFFYFIQPFVSVFNESIKNESGLTHFSITVEQESNSNF